MSKAKTEAKMDSFQSWAHRWGRVGTLIALIYMVALPFVVLAAYDSIPSLGEVFNVNTFSILLIYIPVGFSEALSYTPILGCSAYLAFITGNIMNLKLPVAANAMNLCCTALLASRQRSLTREQLTEQLNCYLDLMRNVPYSTDSTVPSASASELIDHALQMNKFEVEKDTIGDIIILPREQAVLMTYYRNNIAHMLVLPSLMAAIVTQHRHISRDVLMEHVNVLYPMLKAELFLRWDRDELPDVIDALANEMQRQGLITLQDDELHINPAHSRTLQLLAAGARETLQRYAITFWLLSANPSINRGTLEKESRTVAQRLSVLHGINAPEFFDKAVFSSLVLTLRDEGYISDSGDAEPAETMKVYQLLAELITSDVRLTIESATQGEG